MKLKLNVSLEDDDIYTKLYGVTSKLTYMFMSTISETASAKSAICFSNAVSFWTSYKISINTSKQQNVLRKDNNIIIQNNLSTFSSITTLKIDDNGARFYIRTPSHPNTFSGLRPDKDKSNWLPNEK